MESQIQLALHTGARVLGAARTVGRKGHPDPKVLACYGLLVRFADVQTEEVGLRFYEGLPVSTFTTQFLADCCTHPAVRGKQVLLIWGTASWHSSKQVKSWIEEHNRQGRGMQILVYQLPVKVLLLNPIEPKWVQSKQAVVEPI